MNHITPCFGLSISRQPLNKGDYIRNNFTTKHLNKFSYEVGFMQIDEACFDIYMRGFWAELNKDMKMRREGRCIIGKNPDGSDKLCPFHPSLYRMPGERASQTPQYLPRRDPVSRL